MTTPKSAQPILAGAAVLVVGQALVLAWLGIFSLRNLDDERVFFGVGIGLMLMALALGLIAAAGGLVRGKHIARGPVVVTQLIALALAWSLRNQESPEVFVPSLPLFVAVPALAVLLLLATPPARHVLGLDDSSR